LFILNGYKPICKSAACKEGVIQREKTLQNVHASKNYYLEKEVWIMKKVRIVLILSLIFVLIASTVAYAGNDDITTYKQFESKVPNVTEEMLYPEFWIHNTDEANQIIMTPEEIEAFNQANIEAVEPVVDLENYQESFTRDELTAKITDLSSPSSSKRYNANGVLVGKDYYDALIGNLNLGGLSDVNNVRYGLVIRRTEMKTFPTYDRLYSSPTDYNIDRLMETVAYPTEPMIILSVSKDGQWYFAQMYNYLAWIPSKDVAITDKAEMFNYVSREPFLVVTGSKVYSSYNPLNANISELRFDMGTRLPLATADEVMDAFYDQNPAGNFVVKVPTRNEEGNAAFDYVLISRSADVSLGYLPYTKANIIKEAFKLQGERYGWGGMFNGRDCTAFMMDIYRTVGIKLPRNSSEQGKLMVSKYYDMPSAMTLEERKEIFDKMEPGTALYMSGHAMLYLGKYKGEYYMIHDFSGFSAKDESGALINYSNWQVTVTPVTVLRSNGKTYMEALYGAREFILEK
jgi:cell wall-associated NlpC family hydrolase